MRKLISLEMLENPLFLPWFYPDYTPVPDDVIHAKVKTIFSEEPRIFFLSEGTAKKIHAHFQEPIPDEPDTFGYRDPYADHDEILINLPFPGVLIESLITPILQLSCDAPLIKRGHEDGRLNHQFFALAIRETEPLHYESIGIFMAHADTQEDQDLLEQVEYKGAKLYLKDGMFFGVLLLDSSHITDEDYTSTAAFPYELHSHAKAFFDDLKTEYAVGKEKTSQRLRIGTGSNRKLMRVKNILHVAMKKEQKAYAKTLGKEIDWSHRWEVMGHWRKVDTIGKDRTGAYSIKGYTWVVPHIKGNKEKELIKKIRIVKP